MPGTRPGMTQNQNCGFRWKASALHKHRAGALRPLAFAHDAEALGHFGISLDQTAEIPAEAILVELVVGLDVPQATAVR